MSKKRILSLILALIMVISVAPVCTVAEQAGTYLQVKRGSAAYLEPVEDEIYYAGRFRYNSVVESVPAAEEPSADSWYEIKYLYEEEQVSEKETRTVFVRGDSLLPLQPTRASVMTKNMLINDTDDAGLAASISVPEFENKLLISHGYTPYENKAEYTTISYTTRVTSLGDSADFSDILVQMTGDGAGRASNIFTPLIRFLEDGDTNIQYPIDGKSESLLTAEESEPEYIIMSEYNMDPKVIAGIRFILENSPPFKTYTHYPADFENASRVAASLALRAFINDYYKVSDELDIFNNVASQDLTRFNNNYRSYMEYLYYGAVDSYEKAKNTEAVYLSADISKEPHAEENQLITELRVTTNNPQGWIINKSSLPENVAITGAKETDTAYTGDAGSTPISVIAGLDMMGQSFNVNICYNNTEPVVQFACPLNATYPTLVTLAHQSSVIPVKKIELKLPEPATFKIKVTDSETNEPISGVKIRVANSIVAKTLKTDQNGTAAFESAPGKFTYESMSVDGYSSQFKGDITIDSGNEETVSLAFERQKYTISVTAIDAFDDEKPVEKAILTLKSLDNTSFFETKEITDGKTEFTDLPEGQYQVSIEAGKTYSSLEEECKINVHDNTTEEVVVRCVPVGGQIKLGCKLDDEYIENVDIEIYKDGKVVRTAKSTKDGPVYISLPTGTYTVKIAHVPDGYKTSANEKDVKIKKDNVEGIKIKMEPDFITLTVCPRLPSDYDNFKSLKTKIRDKSVSLSGMVFALVAAEDIYNSESELVFAQGDEAVRFNPTKGKAVSAEARVIYPGKYIIRCVQSIEGVKRAEDVELLLGSDKKEVVLPVLVEKDDAANLEELPAEEIEEGELAAEEAEELIEEDEVPVVEDPEEKTASTANAYIYLSIRKPVTASVSIKKDKNGINCLNVEPVYLAADHIPLVISELPIGVQKETQTSELGTVSYTAQDSSKKYIAYIPDNNGVYNPTAVLLQEGSNEADLTIKTTPITMKRVYMQPDAPEKAVYGLFVESWEYGRLTETALKTPLEAHSGLLGMVTFNLPLPAGKYFIAPILDYENGGYDSDSKTCFEITQPGDPVELIENRELMYQVTLTAKDNGTSAGLSGVYLDIAGKDKNVQYYTNTNGQATVWLSPGKYEASVALVPEYYAVSSDKAVFTLQEDGQITGETAIGIDPISLVFKAQNEDGAPLYGVTIEMINQDNKTMILCSTDTYGCALFEKVPFGKYIVKELYPSAGYKTNSKRISLTVDGTYVNSSEPTATFVDQKNTLSCMVYDEQNHGVANCLVAVSDYTNSTVQTAYTDGNGRAVLENIPIGVYYMAVLETPEEYLVPFDTNKVIVTTSGLASNNKLSFNVKWRAINVSLKDSSGNPVCGAEFSLINKEDARVVQRRTTGRDGTVTFTDFTKGEYIVRETEPLNNTAPVKDVDITIDNNWVSDTPIELSTYPNYFEFNVMDNKGQPVALAAFTLENMETHETKGDFSGKSGNVRFNNLEKGTYVIRQTRTEPGYEMSDETITIRIDENYKVPDKKYSYIVRKVQ